MTQHSMTRRVTTAICGKLPRRRLSSSTASRRLELALQIYHCRNLGALFSTLPLQTSFTDAAVFSSFVVLSAPAKDPIRLVKGKHDARSNVRLAAMRDQLFGRLAGEHNVRLIDQFALSKPWLHELRDHTHVSILPQQDFCSR